MTLPILPTGTPYQSIMQGYFGNLAAEEQNQLWQQFVTEYGITQPPLPTDTETLEKYISYINNTYETLCTSELDEGIKTKIIWNIFDILLVLMDKFIKGQVLEQNAVSFLTKYQKQYQEALSKTFFYKGGAPVTDQNISESPDSVYTVIPSPTPDDITTFGLGYGDLTVGDYAQWLYLSTQNATPGETRSITIPYLPKLSESGGKQKYGQIKLSSSRTIDNVYTCTAQIEGVEVTPGGSTSMTSYEPLGTASSSTKLVTTSSDFTAIAQDAFKNAYTAAPDLLKTYAGLAQPPKCNLMLPWERAIPEGETQEIPSLFTYVGNNQYYQNLASLALKFRTERNRVIQTALDALKGKKDVLADKASQQQRLVDSASTALRQTAGILNAIISQLKTLLNQLYK